MADKYDLIVIGSGCGGAASAALGAYHGYRTLLLEKNDFVGGRCATRDIRGFQMDHGHLFARCDKGPHGEVLRIVKSEDLIPPFVYTDDLEAIHLFHGKMFHRKEYHFDTFPMIKIFLVMRNLFDFRTLDFIEGARLIRRIRRLSDEDLRALDKVDVATYVSRHCNNAFINDVFGALGAVMFGALPEEASVGELIRSLGMGKSPYKMSTGYPVNGEGVSAIPKSFMRAAERHGARVRMKTPAKGILVEQGRVRGVEIEGETIYADRVISNAGVRETALKLVGEQHLEPSFVSYLNRLKYSYGGISLKYALDRPIIDFIRGNKVPSDFIRHMSDAMEGRVPEEISIMTVCTSNLDPSLAPEGKQILVAISPGPAVEPGKVRWKPWVESMKRQIAELVPGINDHTLFCSVSTPDVIAHESGRFFGDAVGVAQTIDQIGDKTPPAVSPILGLYNAGADVGCEGVATEMATQSAIDLFKNHLEPS
ncbi:MAG: NAD(P)/FAD-dependent oxidoreductase [Deltaproteobacteria bacterium]|nr:NAD(P)/FAD-dependent oxidoreductase [Deltaproteobacteria bacterium]